MTRKEVEELVAEVIAAALTGFVEKLKAELGAELRAETFERLLEIELRARRPNFQLTPKGDLVIDGKNAGSIKPVLVEALAEALPKAEGEGEQ